MNANDKRILDLKATIEEKKKLLADSKPFKPVTNCRLTLEGREYNLHVMKKPDVLNALVKINALRMSAKDLGLETEYKYGSFSLEDWITDLKSRLAVVSHASAVADLKYLEDSLTALLTDKTKVSIEIDQLAALVNNIKG